MKGNVEKIKKGILIATIGINLLFTNCQKVYLNNNCFYFWKTNFKISDLEKNILNNTKTQKLYLRFFDVDWDYEKNIPIPKQIVNIPNKKLLNKYSIQPVVFITNRTIININENKILNLSKNIVDLVLKILKQNNKQLTKISELQIDCDWSMESKFKYYKLLKEMESILKKNNIEYLTSTIRLHQIRDHKTTGTPPVSKGILMIYGGKSIYDYNESNSIIDPKLVYTYLKNIEKYPLKLDIAVPIFNWGIQFSNNKKFIRLINNAGFDLSIKSNDFVNFKEHYFKSLKDTIIMGKRVMKNDIIKLDSSNYYEIKNILKFLKKRIYFENTILFHLDDKQIIYFTGGDFEKINKLFEVF